jgi:hypothetical protein
MLIKALFFQNIKLLCMIMRGGERRIRTFVGVSQQIYSLPPLATRAPLLDDHSQKSGAGYGTRTRNLLITNQLLYQLS